MNYKGQTELIIIVALLVIIGVVVTTQLGGFIPTSESPDVRNVRESVEGLIRAGALDTLEKMSDQGGYISTSEYQLGSVLFNDKEIPYWQYGGQVSYPDAVSNLRTGVQAYLEANKAGFEETLQGVTLGEPLVGTPVFTTDTLTITVTMPTTYKETPLAQPYTVTMASSFGEIYEFSKGFAIYDANKRPLETYTLSSMLLSPIKNRHHTIPMYEILVGCGDYIFASSFDVIPEVKRAITKTLAYTYMPGKVPLGNLNTSTSPKYTLSPINNKDYENLDVAFMLTDDFELDYSNFRMDPDPATGVAEPIPLLGDCVGEAPVTVNYNLRYPVVVMVSDPETGNPFKFAVDVLIINNTPAEWSVSGQAFTQEELEGNACAFPTCILDMDVMDSSGEPIEGAAISFLGCFLGKTDKNGELLGLAPCGAGSLHIHKRGYSEYLASANSGQLNTTVTLYKRPMMNIIVHQVLVQDHGEGNYMVYYGDVQPVGNKKVFLTFRSDTDFSEHSFYTDDSSLTVNSIPVGHYYISGSMMSNDYLTMYGGFAYTFTIDEYLDDGELHIYIPTVGNFESITDENERWQTVSILSEVLSQCGIGPVRDSPYVQEEACAVTLT